MVESELVSPQLIQYLSLTAQLPRPGAMAVLGRLCTDPEVGLMVEHRDSETVP